MPLAVDVYNIAQNYRNVFESVIKDDGTVTPFRYTDNQDGQPGSALAVNPETLEFYNIPGWVGDMPSQDLMDYETLKATAQQISSAGTESESTSKQTFSNALNIPEDRKTTP